MKCPLCDIEKLTHWYFINSRIIICDDLNKRRFKHRILGILRRHTNDPSGIEKKELLENLQLIADNVIGKYYIDYEQKSIPDHYHIQASEIK